MLKNTASVGESIAGLSSDHADVEIEISAHDLLALSPTQPAAEPDHAASTSTQAPAPDVTATTIGLPPPPTPPTPPPRRRSSRASAALWLCGVTAVAGVAITLYMLVTPVRASRPLLSENPVGVAQEEWPPLPTPEAEVALLEVQEEPVHFVNPFDADEVFEFPHGTTRAEARAAVAEVLAERATERLGRRGAK